MLSTQTNSESIRPGRLKLGGYFPVLSSFCAVRSLKKFELTHCTSSSSSQRVGWRVCWCCWSTQNSGGSVGWMMCVRLSPFVSIACFFTLTSPSQKPGSDDIATGTIIAIISACFFCSCCYLLCSTSWAFRVAAFDAKRYGGKHCDCCDCCHCGWNCCCSGDGDVLMIGWLVERF